MKIKTILTTNNKGLHIVYKPRSNLYISREHRLHVCWKECIGAHRVAKRHITWPCYCQDLRWLCQRELDCRLRLLFSWCDVVRWLDCSILHSSVCIYLTDHSVKGASYQWSTQSPHCSVSPLTIMRKGKLWYWHTLTYSWALLFCLLVMISYEIDGPRERISPKYCRSTINSRRVTHARLLTMTLSCQYASVFCSWPEFWFPFWTHWHLENGDFIPDGSVCLLKE